MFTGITTAPEAVKGAFERAFTRAAQVKMIAWRNADGSYSAPSTSEAGVTHTVRRTGAGWWELSCDCRGGSHPACVHRAAVVYATKYGVWAKRPAVRPANVLPFPAQADLLPPSVQPMRAALR